MPEQQPVLVFGPVPSRRLGQSLGINHIPPKNCSYSCVYCQVGRTSAHSIELREFHPLDEVVAQVSRRVREIRDRGEDVDFLTFVPDGEPTLDVHLGEAIERLRGLGVPIAVISNGSLLWRPEVRAALRGADWVSLKVDSVGEQEWRRINRPHRALQLGQVLEGMLAFVEEFAGELATETLLIREQNDGEGSIREIASFVTRLRPRTAYIGIPTRPTAERWAFPPSEAAVTRAYQLFTERLPRVELLTGYEGTAFGTSGDAEQDLLGITAVHPMREDAVRELLRRSGASWPTVERLIQRGELERVCYQNQRFYVRRFPRLPSGRE
jgi:wyosine [tRNA(Phe)-imidazoG37] synthetase (radical SAM superfamily)